MQTEWVYTVLGINNNNTWQQQYINKMKLSTAVVTNNTMNTPIQTQLLRILNNDVSVIAQHFLSWVQIIHSNTLKSILFSQEDWLWTVTRVPNALQLEIMKKSAYPEVSQKQSQQIYHIDQVNLK